MSRATGRSSPGGNIADSRLDTHPGARTHSHTHPGARTRTQPHPHARRRAHALAVPFALALALGLNGCAGGSPQATDNDPAAMPSPSSTASYAPEVAGSLTVYAAASLQGAFDELATQFEARHPSLEIQPITYDGSSTLATQIVEGAPADVFASADQNTMGRVADAGLAGEARVFATNTLVLVVPHGNPGDIDNLTDLADADLTTVLCAPEVPCGAASVTLLDRAGVSASVDSYEQNVTAVLTKVATGEADAGLVYVTDAATRTDVETTDVDGASDVVNRYPIAALSDAANPAAAAAFVAFVLGSEGQKVLAARGFGAP